MTKKTSKDGKEQAVTTEDTSEDPKSTNPPKKKEEQKTTQDANEQEKSNRSEELDNPEELGNPEEPNNPEGIQKEDSSEKLDEPLNRTELQPLRSTSRRIEPRTVSVYRGQEAQNKEIREPTPYERHLLEEEDEFPTRSPLSSISFFKWGILGAFFAFVIVSFWMSFAEPLFHKSGNPLRESLLSFLNANSRALGILLASVITLCAIAIPLTANNYTSKLIKLFTNSKVNRSMLGLLVVSNGINLLALLLFDVSGHWQSVGISTAAAASTLCFVLVIPYAFYVFHFLEPDEIIRHIEKEVMDVLLEIKREGNGPELEKHRKQVIQNLKNLSNITLRSVDRYDRDTAMLSLEALRHIVHHYFSFKDQMPSQWFHVSRTYFLSLSGEMRRRVGRGKTFLEAEVMEEFLLVLGVTFGRLRDMVRMISRSLRHIGIEANEKDLPSVLELTSLYFNTFLRAAISRKEPEAIYIIVYHYRRMAEEMLSTNEVRPVRVAYYLSYYGHQSVRSGMVYIANLISFDLAHITALAYEEDAPSKQKLFEIFVNFDQEEKVRKLLGVIKSRIKLAVLLHNLGHTAEQETLCRLMDHYDKKAIRIGLQEISEVSHPMYWEVSDRHRHNDYISPALIRSFAFIKQQLLSSPD